MARLQLIALVVLLLVLACGTAGASLLGTYYNLEVGHPDMQGTITGWTPGMVESVLAGPRPTLTAYGHTQVSQFDWWDAQYESFSRLDSDADLQSNFASGWFPLNEGLPGDPYHFAVHWAGQFYVDADKAYDYSMGSDDDSWLFIDGELVLDLGGVHGITHDSYSMDLTEGYHDIEIFFAERHTVASGFQLNFFSDLEPDPPPVPEPSTLLLLASGLGGLAFMRKRRK
ncbi:fibro-slime domain-containing protein [bacterium]|nr:fibro-slime domain-containing protein [bacterium]